MRNKRCMNKRRTALITGGLVLVTAAGLLAYVTRQRKDPSACPYSLRFSLDLPHPFVTRSRLRVILAPEPAQRVLEVGPGTGYYSLHAVRWLADATGLSYEGRIGGRLGYFATFRAP